MASLARILAFATQFVVFLSAAAIWDPTGPWERITSTGPNKHWAAIASSADGTSLAAAGGVDGLWKSSNRGTSWVDVTPSTWDADTHGGFVSITSSGDGKVIGAGTLKGHLFVSVDSGNTWIDRLQASVHITSIASSEDGAKLVATQGKGNIWRSTDFGKNWKEVTNIPISTTGPLGEVDEVPRDGRKWWMSITSSADGAKLAAATWSGNIWTSSDSGATWTERAPTSSPPVSKGWVRICSSASGNDIVVIGRGMIYASRNAGVAWSEKTPAAASPDTNWQGITSSADGRVLAATIWGPGGGAVHGLWTSTDGGDSWTENVHVSTRQWIDIASSASGPVAVIESGAFIWIPTTTLEPNVVDFEDGLTSGGLTFTLISGDLGLQPTTYAAAWDSSNPLSGGQRLFRTDFNGDIRVGDRPQCVYHSSMFTLKPGDISFDYAGNGGLIALCLFEDGSNCRTYRPSSESATMQQGSFASADLKGWWDRRVFFKLADDQSGSWGHIALDNIAFHGQVEALPSNRKVVDFENGLTVSALKFVKISGDIGQQPTTYAAASDSSNPLGGGSRLFRTDFDGDSKVSDRPQGVYHSSVFKLKPGDITFDYAGNGGFIALCLAADPTSCRTNRPSLASTTMQRGAFTAVELKEWFEQRVFFKLADDRSGGWGHLAIDNIVFHGETTRRLRGSSVYV